MSPVTTSYIRLTGRAVHRCWWSIRLHEASAVRSTCLWRRPSYSKWTATTTIWNSDISWGHVHTVKVLIFFVVVVVWPSNCRSYSASRAQSMLRFTFRIQNQCAGEKVAFTSPSMSASRHMIFCLSLKSLWTLCPHILTSEFVLCPQTLQVPLLKEQKQRFCGVQHLHRETPVHREGAALRPASTKLYLVSAAGSGWVRRDVVIS